MTFPCKNRLIITGSAASMARFYSFIQDASTFSFNWFTTEDEKEESNQIRQILTLQYSANIIDITFMTDHRGRYLPIPDTWINYREEEFPNLSFKLYFMGTYHYGYRFSFRETKDFSIEHENNDDILIEPEYDPVYFAFVNMYFGGDFSITNSITNLNEINQ